MNGRYIIQEKAMDILEHRPDNTRSSISETYYHMPVHVPVVKRSHFNWMIAASYFSVGIGGAAQALSAILHLEGSDDGRSLARAGRYIAFAGSLFSSSLYIIDLRTPQRGYNMMRIFRRSSLMSIGSCSLLGLGTTSGMAIIGQFLEEHGYPKLGKTLTNTIAVPALLDGLLASSYMGTEMEETSTPFWADASSLLSSLVTIGNYSKALAGFELITRFRKELDDSIRRLGVLTIITEAVSVALLQRVRTRWTGIASECPLSQRDRFLSQTGFIGLVKIVGVFLRSADLLISSRWTKFRPVASIATLITGYFLPAVVIFAGNRSADRPEDYFSFTIPRPEKIAGNGGGSSEHGGAERNRPMLFGKKTWKKWVPLSLLGVAVGAIAVGLLSQGRRAREGRTES